MDNKRLSWYTGNDVPITFTVRERVHLSKKTIRYNAKINTITKQQKLRLVQNTLVQYGKQCPVCGNKNIKTKTKKYVCKKCKHKWYKLDIRL